MLSRQLAERGGCLAEACHLALALAVIAQARGLEHRRCAERQKGRGQFGNVPNGAVRRNRNAEPADEGFFSQAILGDRKGPGPGTQRLQRSKVFGRSGGDVLELIGDDVNHVGKGGEGAEVIIGGDGLVRRHFEGRTVPVRAVDVGLEAEPGRSERQHAPELAAAKNANGRAEGERLTHPWEIPEPWRSAPRGKR